MARVPPVLEVNGLCLRRLRLSDLDELMGVIQASQAELSHWLPGLDTARLTREAEAAFLSKVEADFDQDRDYHFAVTDEHGAIVGGTGLHPMGSDTLAIGYWAATNRSGRGQTTAVARALTDLAFIDGSIRAVEIHCDAANHASAAIPARLGFRLAGGQPREVLCPGHTGWGLVWRMAREDWGRPDSEVTIRSATPQDRNDLVAAFDSPEFFDGRFGDAERCEIVIAVHNGVAIGDVCVRWDEPAEPEVAARMAGVPCLNHLEVAAGSRRRGVGARLVLAGESRAMARGASQVFLGVEPDNTDARRLYERLGYFPWAYGSVPTRWAYVEGGVEREYVTTMDVLVKTLRRSSA